VRLFLAALATLVVSACAGDAVERTADDSLRRSQERRPAPRSLPGYDEYKRQNPHERHVERL
jgi:hypothetical protein